MALTQYDKNNLTAAQQAGIQAATERYNNATTQAERDAAHAQAEAIRNNAGYTSDTSGAYSGAYQRTIGTTSSPDYSALITQGMARGAGSSEIESLLNQRVSKATGTPGLEQYAYDNVYDSALAYINQAKKAESAQQQAAQNEAYLKELISQYNGQNISYAQALQAQQAAQQAAVQKAVNTLESQKTDTTNQYNDLFRQLYINKMKNQKNIGQQMAAMGVNGGAAESTLLGMNAQYEDALRQGEQGRLDAIRDLDQAIADARLTGDIQSANAAADAARAQTDSYAGVLQNLIDRYDTLEARQQANDRTDAENARRYAYQTAMQILSGGNMASDELLESAGISKADALAIVSQANAGKQETAGYTPTFSQSQVLSEVEKARRNGTPLTGNLLRDYNYYFFGDPDYGG